MLGYCYYYGKGVSEDREGIRQLVSQGGGSRRWTIAVLSRSIRRRRYWNGVRNKTKAVEWYRKAANDAKTPSDKRAAANRAL